MKNSLLCSLLLAVLLASCSFEKRPATATPSIFSVTMSATHTEKPTQTTTPTHTIQPTQTPVRTPRPTLGPLGITEIGNLGKGPANYIEWSPDRRNYILGGSLGIRIFDAISNEETSFVPEEEVFDIEISPNGQLIGVRGVKFVRIIQMDDNETIFKYAGRFTSEMAFSPDSTLFAYTIASACYDLACSDMIIVHDYSAQEDVITLSMPEEDGAVFVRNIAFSSDNSRVAAVGSNGLIYIWDVLKGNLIDKLPEHREAVSHLQFNTVNNNLLASSSDDGTIRIWDIQNQNINNSFRGSPGIVKRIRFSEDGSNLEIITDSFSQIFNPGTGALLSKETFAVSDTSVLQKLQSTAGNMDRIDALAFSPDGQTIAVGSTWSSPVSLWDIARQQFRATIDTRASQLIYSHQGHLLISVDTANRISVWDTSSLENLQKFVISPVDSIIFSPDDVYIAISSKGSIYIWDIQQEQIVSTISSNQQKLIYLSYSRHGDVISAVSARNFSVRSWDISTGEQIHSFTPANYYSYRQAVNLNNNRLAIFKSQWSNSEVEIWNTDSGEKEIVFQDIDGTWVHNFVYSPNHRIVVISSEYSTTFYCSNTGNPIFTYENDVVWTGLSFSPDGKYLATGNAEGNLRLWDVRRVVQSRCNPNRTNEVP